MDTLSRQFGLVVAYLLPGFVSLAGFSLLVPAVARWLSPAVSYGEAGLGIGPPVYTLLAALALGMVVSCFRWIVIDHVHSWTGVIPPLWAVERLEERLGAFTYLVEAHYRYYQFYANTLIAVVWTYALNRWMGTSSLLGPGTDLGVVILCAALFAGSRDALAKYYARTSRLIGQVAGENSGDFMTNGCHHEEGGGAATSKRPETKPAPKPETPKREPGTKKAPNPSK